MIRRGCPELSCKPDGEGFCDPLEPAPDGNSEVEFAESLVAAEPLAESNVLATSSDPAEAGLAVGCFRAQTGEKAVSKRKNAANLLALGARFPSNTQNFLSAVHEVVMAAPPNPNCSFSRRTRCGPAVRLPRYIRVPRVGVRFVSGRPGLPQPPVEMPSPLPRRKSAASPAFECPPESRPPTMGLQRISVKPGVMAARRNCGPRRFSRGSTAGLPAKPPLAPGGESTCRSFVPPADR